MALPGMEWAVGALDGPPSPPQGDEAEKTASPHISGLGDLGMSRTLGGPSRPEGGITENRTGDAISQLMGGPRAAGTKSQAGA